MQLITASEDFDVEGFSQHCFEYDQVFPWLLFWAVLFGFVVWVPFFSVAACGIVFWEWQEDDGMAHRVGWDTDLLN